MRSAHVRGPTATHGPSYDPGGRGCVAYRGEGRETAHTTGTDHSEQTDTEDPMDDQTPRDDEHRPRIDAGSALIAGMAVLLAIQTVWIVGL